MIPILYQTITEGTVPTNYGIGALTDCIFCKVTEKRNGSYELALTYAAEGIHASEIQPNRFIKVKPNYTDNAQIFRIYKVGKIMGGKFEVNAQHISYDLSGKVITTGSAANCVAACALLEAQAGNFTISTDKTTVAAFSVSEPSSVRSWFGGKQGSLLDVYGGEWYYDNYSASLKTARGLDRGVTIRYGKNLTQLSQILDMSNLVTGVIPYYIDANGNKTVGTKVSTGLVLDVDKDVAIDFSQEVNPESGTAIATQLVNLANRYIANNNLTTFSNSITLDFVQMKGLTERVDLCDTVHIYFEALGITATVKCVATEWDALEERYTKCTFGDVRTDITDTIVNNSRQLEQTPTTSFMTQAITRATELITGNLGGYVVLHDANGDGEPDEILIMDTADINTATKVWRWNKNGLGYSSNGYAGTFGTAITADGKIVADYVATGTLDASKITVSHLSASSIDTGTLDGTKATITNINASNINTGTLNADLIKAGVISDVAGNSSINMTNGVATMKNFKAKDSLTLVDSSNKQRAWIGYTAGSGSALRAMDGNGHPLASMDAQNSGYGMVAIGDSNKEQLGTFACNSAGAGIYLASLYNGLKKTGAQLFSKDTGGLLQIFNNPDQNLIAEIGTGSDRSGHISLWGYVGQNLFHVYRLSTGGCYMALFKNDTTQSIYMNANSGAIVCVSLTQTSSRKVKKNIKPIEDAEKILELQAVSFDYIDEDLGTDKRGFIAEDVAEVLPNLVTPETEEHNATLDYMEMIPYLQAVIKEQDERIKALEDRLNKLEG